jgi:hypothetical protein
MSKSSRSGQAYRELFFTAEMSIGQGHGIRKISHLTGTNWLPFSHTLLASNGYLPAERAFAQRTGAGPPGVLLENHPPVIFSKRL